jgi:hypothetical protein
MQKCELSRARANGLKLYPAKSQVIVIHRFRRKVLTSFLFGPIEIKMIPKVFVANYLSLFVADQFSKVCQKQKVYSSFLVCISGCR